MYPSPQKGLRRLKQGRPLARLTRLWALFCHPAIEATWSLPMAQRFYSVDYTLIHTIYVVHKNAICEHEKGSGAKNYDFFSFSTGSDNRAWREMVDLCFSVCNFGPNRKLTKKVVEVYKKSCERAKKVLRWWRLTTRNPSTKDWRTCYVQGKRGTKEGSWKRSWREV